ncbi:MAG TPA: hypothetical protein VF006_13340 [Longimicrobium sp.]
MQDAERLRQILFTTIGRELSHIENLRRGTRIGENEEVDELDFDLLLAVIEDRFGVVVPSEDAAMMKRIGDLIDWVTDRYQMPPPSRARLLINRLLSKVQKLVTP